MKAVEQIRPDVLYWVETKSKIEELYIKDYGTPIPDSSVADIINSKSSDIVLNGDGFHYRRIVSGNVDVIDRMLFCLSATNMQNFQQNFPVQFQQHVDEIKRHIIKESRYAPKLSEIEAAKHIVDMFIDAYEHGLTQVGGDRFNELSDSISTIKESINSEKCPPERLRAMKFAVTDGQSVLEQLSIIKFGLLEDNCILDISTSSALSTET